MRIRSTLRVRLTAVYAVSFFLAGALILGVVYVLVGYNIDRAPIVGMSLPAPAGETVFRQTPAPLAGPGETGEIEPVPDHVFERAIGTVRAETLRALLLQSVAVLAVIGALAIATGWVLAGRVLRPLAQITETARRVADRSLHERIALVGPADELKELADTFDAMLDRLDRSFDAQRRFVGNASHELRTPLAIQRTVLEVALARKDRSADLAQVADVLLTTNERSERLIDGLLLLARSEQTLTAATPLDLAEVARVVVDQAAGEATHFGITVRTAVEPAPCEGEPVLLEQLVANLVQNAVRHNVEGGTVDVTTGTSPTGDATVTVVNTGPQVPAYDVDGLFEPFRRGTDRVASDRGVGLGLSIVRSIANAHHGVVHAEPGPAGGLHVTVKIPRTFTPV